MKNILLLLVITLLFIGFSVHAQEKEKHPIDKWLEKFMNDEKNQDTYGIQQGYMEAHEKWDKELNKVYNALMKKLPKDAKESLKSSQKAWLKFRDEEFKLIGSAYYYKDGTMWNGVIAEEMMNVVRTRVLVLQEYLDYLNEEWE